MAATNYTVQITPSPTYSGSVIFLANQLAIQINNIQFLDPTISQADFLNEVISITGSFYFQYSALILAITVLDPNNIPFYVFYSSIVNIAGSIGPAGPTGPVGPSINSNYIYVPGAGNGNTLIANPGLGAFIIDPAGELASLNVIAPPSPSDGQVFNISTTQTIDSLTIYPATGAILLGGGPFMLSANSGISFKHAIAQLTWYRKY